MSEHRNITDFLLLSVLATLLLVSGGLQYTFDSLTGAQAYASAVFNCSVYSRTDDCHPSYVLHPVPVCCQDKACHPHQSTVGDLGTPQIYQLVKLAQPLLNSDRQPEVNYRPGSTYKLPAIYPQLPQQPQMTSPWPSGQTLSSIRATVLLC